MTEVTRRFVWLGLLAMTLCLAGAVAPTNALPVQKARQVTVTGFPQGVTAKGNRFEIVTDEKKVYQVDASKARTRYKGKFTKVKWGDQLTVTGMLKGEKLTATQITVRQRQ
jgi:hypothetical protein